MLTEKVINSILAERKRQDDKWGIQRHQPDYWMLIAIEEVGEIAQALLQNDRESYRKELIQTAAVFVAWLESEFALTDGEDIKKTNKL